MLSSRMTPSELRDFVNRTGSFIAVHQLPSGAIPYYVNGVVDPWDHVECAIALDMCGMTDLAASAYRWLAQLQNPDGSWWYTYRDNQPEERTRDSNHSAYVASGVWYHYRVTGDKTFLKEMWPVVEKGLQFTLDLQQPTGEVYWARDFKDEPWPSAPLSGSSCIYQSITSGIRLAGAMGLERPEWKKAANYLLRAILYKPHLFDVHHDNQRGYAMNWYYPVLTGAVTGRLARDRINNQWDCYVADGQGCKCSLDQSWVTVAETCELAMALVKIGEHERADSLLQWVLRMQDSDGGFWTGINIDEELIYPPGEKTTWTAAGVILAFMADTEKSFLDIL